MGLSGVGFGQGSLSAGGKQKEKQGADYEDLIVYNYNKLVGDENHDQKKRHYHSVVSIMRLVEKLVKT